MKCEECNGTGAIETQCDSCEGTGNDCIHCGRGECMTCEGAGVSDEDCTACDGTGETDDPEVTNAEVVK